VKFKFGGGVRILLLQAQENFSALGGVHAVLS
jgi:hypothetical protein